MIDKLLIENKNPYPKNYDRGFSLKKYVYSENLFIMNQQP